MVVYKEIRNDVTIIKPHGMLKGGSGIKILDKVLSDIKNDGIRACIIDFADISSVNRMGLDYLIKRKDNFRKSGKLLQFININQSNVKYQR